MFRRQTLAASLLIFLAALSSTVAADDEIGVDKWVVPGTATGVVNAIADGSIWDILAESGLHDQLESQWPAANPGSPKAVFVNIYIKVSFFIESYVVKIQIPRADNQSWHEALGGGVDEDEEDDWSEDEEENEDAAANDDDSQDDWEDDWGDDGCDECYAQFDGAEDGDLNDEEYEFEEEL